MSDYKEMYYFLFNGITRIIDELQEKENNMKDMPCIIKLKKNANRCRRDVYIRGLKKSTVSGCR